MDSPEHKIVPIILTPSTTPYLLLHCECFRGAGELKDAVNFKGNEFDGHFLLMCGPLPDI